MDVCNMTVLQFSFYVGWTMGFNELLRCDINIGTCLHGNGCRMLDDTYKLDKCVKIALLYLEVKLNMLNIQISCI